MKKYDYDRFSEEIENATNHISLKKGIATARHGKAGLRDKLVFGKVSWSEAITYISFMQSIVIFTALIPNSVGSLNAFMAWIGIPIEFPVELMSTLSIIFIICIFIFGLIAVRHIGTTRRTSEIGSKLNPATFMLWEKLEKVERKLEEIEVVRENGKESVGDRLRRLHRE